MLFLPFEVKFIPSTSLVGMGSPERQTGEIIHVRSAPTQTNLRIEPVSLTIANPDHFLIHDIRICKPGGGSCNSIFAGIIEDGGILASNIHQHPIMDIIMGASEQMILSVSNIGACGMNFYASLNCRPEN